MMNRYKNFSQQNKRNYISLKNRGMVGGTLTTLPNSEKVKFDREWRNVSNSGQHNCGIYVNPNQPDKIVKCVKGNIDDMNDQSQYVNLKSGYDVFPKIHRYFTFEGDRSVQTFIEMDRLTGDVTDLITSVLPKLVIDDMIKTGEIPDKQTGDDLLKLFTLKMPSTFPNNDIGVNFYMNAITKFIISEREKGAKIPSSDDELSKTFDRARINDPSREYLKVKDVKDKIDLFDSFVSSFKTSTLSEKIYNTFINKLKTRMQNLIDVVNDQIFILNLTLLKNGYIYRDNKYDNYGFMLETAKRTHLGIDWGDFNKIGDNYFYISILDWESGLFVVNDQDITFETDRLIRTFRDSLSDIMSVHGQYNLKRLNQDILPADVVVLFADKGVPEEIIKIMRTQVTYEQHSPENTQNIASIETGIEYITDKYSDKYPGLDDKTGDIKSIVTSLLKSGVILVSEPMPPNEVLLIATGRNNFLKLVHDTKDNSYTVILLNDRRRPATTYQHWAKGEITTMSKTQVRRFIKAVYELD